jgi:poly(3-hydroxybutyrate) depolymerase
MAVQENELRFQETRNSMRHNSLSRWASIGLCAAGAASAAAATTWNIKVGTATRNAIVYVPTGITKPAIIIQCHGMNQDAAYQQAQAKWEPIADTGKFIVVFPNGNNKSWDLSGNADIDFMKAIIDTMVKKHGADRDRAYLSGFSMGGMFTYTAMNKMADRIAAFAPCSGYPMGGMTPSSSRPVPIMHIHGTTDDVVGYSGVEGTLSKWRTWNNCPTTKTTIKPYPANKPSSASARDSWSPCTKNGKTVEVALITNTGKGHWYSMDQAGAVSSVEIWNFSKKYSLSGSAAVEPSRAKFIDVSASYRDGAIVLASSEELRSVTVRDLAGRSLSRWNAPSNPTESVSIPVARSEQGVYLLDVVGAEGRRTLRVVAP